jgi:hypothetical protein
MKLIYFISQLKLTASFTAEEGQAPERALNERLRPHLAEPEDQEGDFVHADLEEAKRLARDIVFDIGDKGIDVLAIGVEDDVYEGLSAAGDIRDSRRTDPYGGRLLKLSQRACQVINDNCDIVPVRYMLPLGHVSAPTMVQ